jgi:plasmid stabilization system protein ParE
MRVRWTEPSARDLTNICDYISERDGAEAAPKVALRIYEAIGGLVRFPHLGRSGRKRGTRELILSDIPYLAVYRLRDDEIEIDRILLGAEVALGTDADRWTHWCESGRSFRIGILS